MRFVMTNVFQQTCACDNFVCVWQLPPVINAGKFISLVVSGLQPLLLSEACSSVFSQVSPRSCRKCSCHLLILVEMPFSFSGGGGACVLGMVQLMVHSPNFFPRKLKYFSLMN